MGREFSPFDIGERFRILPTGTDPSGDERIDMIMAPGAFGSGEHETTASCIEALENLPELQGARVLDLGSGTGILAIAALKLGAASALCVDIDPAAVETCRLNGDLNGVGDRLEHYCGTLDSCPAETFDVILGNIYGDILLMVADDLAARAKPGAPLLLSGILWEYNYDVRSRYERLGCEVVKNRMMEEFSTVLLRKD